jgi:inhibitor of KinA
MPSFRVLPAGDAALVVELPERIDPALNTWCVALAGSLAPAVGTKLRDVVVGYCSVTVYFDPLKVDAAWLEAEIRSRAGRLEAGSLTNGGLIEVPVRYGGDLGPDLADVAAFAGCSEQEVIDLHAGREYRVYMLGFIPGFAYMAEVAPQIAAPRRATPRTAVPAGSVAIAGGQTGIYPAVTPGGWNIIGRTPLQPYDPDRREPFLFKSGDRVRFRPIEADQAGRA